MHVVEAEALDYEGNQTTVTLASLKMSVQPTVRILFVNFFLPLLILLYSRVQHYDSALAMLSSPFVVCAEMSITAGNVRPWLTRILISLFRILIYVFSAVLKIDYIIHVVLKRAAMCQNRLD